MNEFSKNMMGTQNREEALEERFEALKGYLEDKKFPELMRTMDELNPADTADFLSELSSEVRPAVFRMLNKEVAAEVFAYLDKDIQEETVSLLTDLEVSSILEELYSDDAADMLEEMPANVVKRILKNAKPETRAEINRLLSYPEDSAGSLMTGEYVSVRKEMTCREAMEAVRRTGVDKETVYVLYVTDRSRFLSGTVSFKDILFSDPDAKIEDVMETDIVSAVTTDNQEDVVAAIEKYSLLALPITDKEGRMVGIVTVDDAMSTLIEEAAEDLELMGAITPSDKPYMRMSIWEIWKKRIPWLLLLMLSATFTSMIIMHYENAIGTYAILTAFFPMLMGTGGNAGSQASVTVIRGISLGELDWRDVPKIVWKEFRVSLLCGLTLAAVCFVKTMLIDFRLQWQTVTESGDVQNNLLVAGVVSLTVLAAILIAKIVGSILPMGAKKLGLDPAVMASPFISTIVDTITLMVYFSIATMFLPI